MNNTKNTKGKPYLLMGLFSLLILTIAYFVKPETVSNEEFFYDAVVNIAFIFGTIAIVNYGWACLGGDPVENLFRDGLGAYELYSDGFESGLLRAHPKASAYATAHQWMEILGDAKKSVDMMGYSLRTFTESKDFENTIVSLAKRNVKVRIMIMHKENDHLGAGLNEKVPVANSTRNDIDLCEHCVKKAIDRLPDDKKSNIQFAFIKNGITEMQIIRVDRYIYVTPYMYSLNTSDSPLFVCREQEDGYYKKYCGEFNALWELNPITEEKTAQMPID